MKKILVPIARNIDDKNAIDEAVKLAKEFGSKVVLFNVNDSKEKAKEIDYGGYIEEDRMYEKFKDTSFLEEIKQNYEGVDFEILMAEGDPASEIIDEADNGDYDLVVMQTHTMKERKRFMMGSVSNKVVHHIKKPIMIIR
jgi:nucleotide-binding universal stress UspA family protein